MKKEINSKNVVFHIISNVISWSIFAILAIIALFLVYYVIAAQLYANKGEKYKPAFALYTIISGSMEPTIKVYDVVFDVKVDDPSKLKEGDVITFVSSSSLTSGETITHRIKQVIETDSGLKFRTKGDNNPVPDDAYVDADKVLGKVAFKIPQLGRIQFLILKSGGWLFLILIPSLGIVIYDVLRIFNLDKTKKKVNKTINAKKELVLDKKEQEELKKKIKDRLENKNSGKDNNYLPIKTDVNDEITVLKKNALDSLYKGAKEEEETYVRKDLNMNKILDKLNNDTTINDDIYEVKLSDDTELPKMKSEPVVKKKKSKNKKG